MTPAPPPADARRHGHLHRRAGALLVGALTLAGPCRPALRAADAPGASSTAPAERVARSRAQALGGAKVRFCHDASYPLSPREARWCELLPTSSADDAPAVCPAFARACAAGARAWDLDPPSPRASVPLVGAWLRGLLWALLAAIAGGLLWLVARNLLSDARPRPARRRRALRSPSPAPAAGDEPHPDEAAPEALALRARAALAAGDAAQALALVHTATLRALARRHLIALHPASTSGEYLRALRASAPALAAQVRPMLEELDAHAFAGQRIEPSAGVRLLDRLHALLSALGGPALLVVAFLLGAGCTASPRGDGEYSPSGHAAMLDFLRRDGLDARERLTSLRRLDGDTGQVVLLGDARLDDDDWRAVAEWLELGGRLVLAPGPAELPAWLPVKIVRHGAEDASPARLALGPALRAELGELRPAVPSADRVELTDGISREPLLHHDGGVYAYVLQTQVQAELLVLASEALLQNASLALPDNARLVRRLLGDREGTIDLVGGLTGQVAVTPPEAIRRARMAPLVWQLLLTAVALFVARGAMFARPRRLPPPPRRRFVEHAHALGLLYRRAQAREHALVLCTAHALERLHRRLHLAGERGVARAADALARRTGRPRDEIARLLLLAREPIAPAGQPPRARAAALTERERALRALDGWLDARAGSRE